MKRVRGLEPNIEVGFSFFEIIEAMSSRHNMVWPYGKCGAAKITQRIGVCYEQLADALIRIETIIRPLRLPKRIV